MKRALETSLLILIIAGTPALAADEPRHMSGRTWDGRVHDVHGRRDIDPWLRPGFIWLGHPRRPLLSWDDGFFADLKYRRHPYRYWPYRHHPSGDVEVVNGEAVYRYDRNYPYDRYERGRYGSYGSDWGGYDRSAPARCRVERVWSKRDRKQVPVRICSN